MRCQLCKSFTPHEETGLPELETRLSNLDKFRHCRPGWTRYASEHWVCSSCLDQGRALPGDPGVQDCRGGAPIFFAHWDETKLCVYCGKDFIFTAGEKKYWGRSSQPDEFSGKGWVVDRKRKIEYPNKK